MPALTNPRQELFVLKLVEGMSQTAAYTAAGFTGGQQCASHLASRPKIAARRAELLARVAGKAGVTAEQLIEQAQAAYKLAMATEQPSAAVAAIREIGILAGVRVEKRSSTVRSVKELSDEELMVIAAGHGH
jgi:phage terminase small subunit